MSAARKPAAKNTAAALRKFNDKVASETRKLKRLATQGAFADTPHLKVGCTIEAWLLSRNFSPLPVITRLIGKYGNNPDVKPGPSRFCVRLGGPTIPLRAGVLGDMWSMLSERMNTASDSAAKLDARLMTIGILPTISLADMNERMLTAGSPYMLLSHGLRKLDRRDSDVLDVQENDGLRIGSGMIVPEAVTGAQHIRLEVPMATSGNYCNAMYLLAGPLVAANANSPFFLGRHLWEETRVMLIERMAIARWRLQRRRTESDLPKGMFGFGYVGPTIVGLFEENSKRFPAVVAHRNLGRSAFASLIRHNETVPRWVRPRLVLADRKPVCELVFSAMSSGPTVADTIANIALFTGSVAGLANRELEGASPKEIENLLPFATAQKNFLACARDGLAAQVDWIDGTTMSAADLILEKLVPLAREGLAGRGVNASEIYRELNIIIQRVRSGRNGASWQQTCREMRSGGSLALSKLAESYWHRQSQNRPVHAWSI